MGEKREEKECRDIERRAPDECNVFEEHVYKFTSKTLVLVYAYIYIYICINTPVSDAE